MHKLFLKNYIPIVFLIVLCFIVLAVSFLGIGRNYIIADKAITIQGNALELAKMTASYLSSGSVSDWELKIMLSTIANSTGNHCFITDKNGLVIACSDMNIQCEHLGKSIQTDFANTFGQNISSSFTSLDGFYSEKHFVSAVPILLGEDIIAYVFVSAHFSNIVNVWNSLMIRFVSLSLIVMAIALIAGFIAAKKQAKPVNEMADAALRFAHGDFSARVSGSERDDEIGALASSFNTMADSLQTAEKRRSDFLANVAHELKTPMTTISGFADGILDGTIPPEMQGKYLETISEETKRLSRLVRKMLEISRMSAQSEAELKANSFDAAEVLTRTLLVFENKVDVKKLNVDVLIPEESITVLGDKDMINQVIYNLIENAIKFAPEGGELGVSLFKQNGKAYISVRNSGPTIPPEELSMVFDRFHKTDKSRALDRDGVGLGLYIVKTIINNHGEDIVVRSEDGITEFVFSLTLKPQ